MLLKIFIRSYKLYKNGTSLHTFNSIVAKLLILWIPLPSSNDNVCSLLIFWYSLCFFQILVLNWRMLQRYLRFRPLVSMNVGGELGFCSTGSPFNWFGPLNVTIYVIIPTYICYVCTYLKRIFMYEKFVA